MMNPHLLGDRYELLHRLGAGGMAQVFLARDTLLGRNVAVKILNEAGARDPSFVERFRREAQAAAALNHPNVATIYDWGESPSADADRIYFMVMEYVPGPNLKELLQERGALPEAEALDIAIQIASALSAAHAHGLIHRDVKPQNIQIDPFGRAKVVDFGIAHAAGLSQLTATNMVSGTAHYLSPEQAQRRPLDARSDVYSLGVVLFEMVTGRVPFEGSSMVDVALQHLNEQPQPPREIRPEISAETEATILKALAKDPGRRFESAADMRSALERTRERVAREQPVIADTTAIGSFASAQYTEPIPRPATVRLGSLPVGPRPRLRATSHGNAAWRLSIPVLALLLALGGAGFYALSSSSDHHSRGALQARPTDTVVARPTPRPTTRPAVKPPTATARPAPTSTSAPVPAATAAPKPTNGARPTSVPQPTAQVAALTAPRDPARAVSDFYYLVAQHRFGAAAQLWTSDMQTRFPPGDNIDSRFGDLQSVDIRKARTTSQSDGSATVAVDVVLHFSSGTQEFAGSWSVVPDGNGWLLASPSLYQVG